MEVKILMILSKDLSLGSFKKNSIPQAVPRDLKPKASKKHEHRKGATQYYPVVFHGKTIGCLKQNGKQTLVYLWVEKVQHGRCIGVRFSLCAFFAKHF